MRVLLLHNAVTDEASTADRDVLVQVEAVSQAISQAGHEPISLPVTLDLGRLRESLSSCGPDMLFNLVESLGGSDRLAFLTPALLDVLGYPYSGSPTRALFLLGDKLEAKRQLRSAGFPTADWVSRSGNSPREPETAAAKAGRSPATRYIIKPVHEHASFGIDAGAVVDVPGLGCLESRLSEREQKLGTPCFAERFVEGRELNLSLLAGRRGPDVLPPAEIVFSGFSADAPRIVDYRAKWDPDSIEYHGTPRRFEFPAADRPLLEELARLARSSWQLFGLRGYARVDFRVDVRGRPWILEINANPCLSPDAGFAAALDRAGISFPEAVERILADAVRPLAGTSLSDPPRLSAGSAAPRRTGAPPAGAAAIGLED
jgi:D-alanine-D-alanine ligase